MHVYVGRDEVTGKQRYLTRTVHGTKREAEKVFATLVVDASKESSPPRRRERWRGSSRTGWPTRAARLPFDDRHLSGLRTALDRAPARRQEGRSAPAHDFDRFYVELRKHLGAASVLKVHTILRSALQQAVRWRMLSENPAALVTRPRPVTPPIRPPTPEQVARLLAAADEYDPDLAVYLRLAAVTGARRGELCALKWSDVDLEDGEVLIARSLALGTHEVVEKERRPAGAGGSPLTPER